MLFLDFRSKIWNVLRKNKIEFSIAAILIFLRLSVNHDLREGGVKIPPILLCFWALDIMFGRENQIFFGKHVFGVLE